MIFFLGFDKINQGILKCRGRLLFYLSTCSSCRSFKSFLFYLVPLILTLLYLIIF
nr:MAG TPA: arsenate reductase [Caudoviricetes sp.]